MTTASDATTSGESVRVSTIELFFDLVFVFTIMQQCCSSPRRFCARVGLVGYWYAHLAMLAGIVLMASALKEIVSHGEQAALWPAWVLAGGLALYLAGDVYFRWVLELRPLIFRITAALAAVPLGLIGGVAELGALGAVMIAMLILEYLASHARPGLPRRS